MTIRYATQTLARIEEMMTMDQGSAYRVALGKVIPHVTDAYRGGDSGFRSHLGASLIGRECDRQIWYGFRWAKKAFFPARILRLFNRGHLEEARFIAILLSIGVEVYQQDANGNQFRISELGGHFGGSGDGVGIGIPDLPSGTPCLLEFKTHGEKSFNKLVKEGVRSAKFEHFVQMSVYMRKMGLTVALYGAVNKNTDDLHLEIVYLDERISDIYVDRAKRIIMMKNVPDKMNMASPGLFECRYCDYLDNCHHNKPLEHNCRTCMDAQPREDGTWWCESKTRQLAMLFPECDPADASEGENFQLSKERQLTGCKSHYRPV